LSDGGYHRGRSATAAVGMDYWLLLDDRGSPLPDPASRFQPQGVFGPSRIVEPKNYRWQDEQWDGVSAEDRPALYEMHIGTFTPAGTWAAAQCKLPELAALGLGVIEMMPIAEFPGSFGWSYDAAQLFAPSHLYGQPDELRSFIDHAHQLG